MSCPNSDPNFDATLNNFVDIKSSNYANTRMALFYFVCIWVRYALYTLVYFHRDNYYIPFIVAISSLISIVNLSSTLVTDPKTYFRPWWSKTFQLINAIIIVIVCYLVHYKLIKSIYIPMLLFISLAGGVIQSLFINFC